MFLFSPSRVILFLNRNSLSLYTEDGEFRERLSFDKNYLDHLEILDKDKFGKDLASLFKRLNISGKKA